MSTPLQILQQFWQHRSFKPQQEAIINSVLNDQDTFVLLPTGAGKSVCYQIPALLKDGVCIVISPLIALIEDQVSTLKKRGIKALAITGAISTEELTTIFDNCRYGDYKFLYLSPERLKNELVLEHLKTINCSFIAVDEAHCISQWGNDFRPAYKEIKILKTVLPNKNIIALTATATPKVQEDIKESLELKTPNHFQTSFKRNNIAFKVIHSESKYSALITLLKSQDSSCIIYVSQRKATLQLCNYLKDNNIFSLPFHGGLNLQDKKKYLEAWLQNKCNIIVATSAFGMGIDKPNVGSVIHFNLPESIENYYQEAGRAGRNGMPSQATILKNNGDIELINQQYLSILPTKKDVKQMYKHLNNYFQISYGEGLNTTHDFSFTDFCDRYQLNYLKTYHTLGFLERQGIIRLSKQYKNNTEITFKVSNNVLLNYLERNPNLSIVTQSILRTYGGVMDHKIQLNIDWLSKKLGLNNQTFNQCLTQLHRDEIAEVHFHETDASVSFLVPREDDYTINLTLKYLKQQNETKKLLVKHMISYVNHSGCKQNYILNYFGEETSERCGICSSCKQENKDSIHTFDDLKKQILKLVQNNPVAITALPNELNLTQAETSSILKKLLDEHYITINSKNEARS